MSQLNLNLLARIDGPSVVPAQSVGRLSDYREAVRHCWAHRRSSGMTRSTLAELTGMRASHISDYFEISAIDRHGNDRRDMPAKYIKAFELVCGNTFVSQFIAHQSKLTILETMLMQAAA